jgi:nucleotide-binding universal stress UspA family protein
VRTNRIVVGVDGSEHANRALVWAVQEAALRHASLDIIQSASSGERHRRARHAHIDALTHANTLAEQTNPLVVVRARYDEGSAADALVKASTESDLLVLGTRGHSAVSELVLGSTSRACVEHSLCPVVLVHRYAPETNHREHARIVVEVDGSDSSSAALHWALEEGARRSTQVETVYSCSDQLVSDNGVHLPGTCAELEGAFTQVGVTYAQRPGFGHLFSRRARCEPSADAVLESGQAADLLVVGAQSHHTIHDSVAGSLAHRCVDRAPCPVVVMAHASSTTG